MRRRFGATVWGFGWSGISYPFTFTFLPFAEILRKRDLEESFVRSEAETRTQTQAEMKRKEVKRGGRRKPVAGAAQNNFKNVKGNE